MTESGGQQKPSMQAGADSFVLFPGHEESSQLNRPASPHAPKLNAQTLFAFGVSKLLFELIRVSNEISSFIPSLLTSTFKFRRTRSQVHSQTLRAKRQKKLVKEFRRTHGKSWHQTSRNWKSNKCRKDVILEQTRTAWKTNNWILASPISQVTHSGPESKRRGRSPVGKVQ